MNTIASEQESLWSHWIQPGFIWKLPHPTNRMISAPGGRQQTTLTVSLSINTIGTDCSAVLGGLPQPYVLLQQSRSLSSLLKLSISVALCICRLSNLELLLRFGSNARRRHNQSLEGHVHRYSAHGALRSILASLLSQQDTA